MSHFKFPIVILIICLSFSSCSLFRKKSANDSDGSNAGKSLIKKYEMAIGQDINARKSYQLYLYIDNWMGTPYCFGGASKKCTDCSGFISNIYTNVYHLKIPRNSNDMMESSKKVKQKKLKEGDLVFFDTNKSHKASHVGLYLGNKKFVHASTSKGVRIDDLSDKYYDQTYIKGGRMR